MVGAERALHSDRCARALRSAPAALQPLPLGGRRRGLGLHTARRAQAPVRRRQDGVDEHHVVAAVGLLNGRRDLELTLLVSADDRVE